jgi:hypothetical protein
LISDVVEEKLVDLLGDPDSNLEMKEEILEKLRESLERETRGEPGISAERVAEKLGLSW